jgi:hypothetical protein
MATRKLQSVGSPPSRPKWWPVRWGLAGLAVAPILILSASAGAATLTLLDVSGAGTTGQIVASDTAAAVSFSLDKAYTNVAISAGVLCVGCTGEVLLLKDQIGAGATLANYVTGLSFDTSTQTTPLLSGLDLGAGTYFLMLAITGASGGGGWIGSNPATVTTAPGIVHGLDLFAKDLGGVSYASNFQAVLSAQALHYTIVADIGDTGAPVPEPTAWVLMMAGFGLAGLRLRRRTVAHGTPALL